MLDKEQPDVHLRRPFLPVKRITYARCIVMPVEVENSGCRWNYDGMRRFSAGRGGGLSADCFKVWFARCRQEGEIRDNDRRMIDD